MLLAQVAVQAAQVASRPLVAVQVEHVDLLLDHLAQVVPGRLESL